MIQAIKQFLCNQERKKFKKQEAEQPFVPMRYPNVYQVSNVYYGHGIGSDDVGLEKEGDPDYRMDLFYDEKAKRKLPIIISIHGGGLITGNKEFNKYLCREFAAKEFLVYAIEHPKLPEHTIDEVVEAIVTAIRMIVYSAAAMEGDPESVFIVGDSAGAFLTVYATAILHNPKLADEFGIETGPYKVRITGLALICGMFYADRNNPCELFYKFLFSGKNTKKDAVKRYRSPERNEVAGSLPPCIFITSEGDFLNKHSHSFAAALLLFSDILVSFEEYQDPTLVHDFPLFQCDRDETGDAIRKICSFFWYCIWREKNVKTIPVY